MAIDAARRQRRRRQQARRQRRRRLFIHASDEQGSFGCPKSVEIGLFNDPGSVYFRDVEPFAQQQWAFRAPDFAAEFEKPMGEWNELKVICHDNRLTVFLNGTPINQVDGLSRTKGSIALQSQTASFKAPSYYRNIKLQPISDAAKQEGTAATAQLAKLADLAIQKKAAAAARELEKQLEAKKRAKSSKPKGAPNSSKPRGSPKSSKQKGEPKSWRDNSRPSRLPSKSNSAPTCASSRSPKTLATSSSTQPLAMSN